MMCVAQLRLRMVCAGGVLSSLARSLSAAINESGVSLWRCG